MVKINKDKLVKEIMGNRKPIKIKRKRKPMSAEQKVAAAERLQKARELKLKKNGPTKNKQFHNSVYNSEKFELQDVLRWLKNAKDMSSSYRQSSKTKFIDNKERAKNTTNLNLWEGYVQDINWYLRTGDWISDYWGEDMNNKTKWIVVASGNDEEFYEGRIYNIDDLKKVDENPIIRKRTRRKKNETE